MSDYKKVVQLNDLLSVPAKDNGEELVLLDNNILKAEYKKKDMVELAGEGIWVRKDVADKLYSIQKTMDKRFQLYVVYGYRSPEIQKKYYTDRFAIIEDANPNLTKIEVTRLTHLDVADPDVAGHPTGGAIDLTIWDRIDDREVDMGSAISQFGDIAYTEYPDISQTQKDNRLWLNKIMKDTGFAPFMGEWWHFSYGDKEWAYFYKKRSAIYETIPQNRFLAFTENLKITN